MNRSLRSIKLYDGSKEVGQISLCQESHEDS